MLVLFCFIKFIESRRKKDNTRNDIADDEPNRYQPEFGKVWHPDHTKWNHYVGRERYATVAFIEDNVKGRELASVFEKVLNMVDPSKVNLVVADYNKIKDIIDSQGIAEFPLICFYKTWNKKYSYVYDGYFTSKAIASWINTNVIKLDEKEEQEFEDEDDEI